MSKIELSNRKTATVDLSEFCIFSMGVNKDRGDWLEVSEWSNGEGFDIDIQTGGQTIRLQITTGQFDAMKKCIKLLYKP